MENACSLTQEDVSDLDSDRRFDIRLANSNYFSLGHQARAVALALIKHYDKPFAEIAREAGLEGDSKTLKRILRNKQFQRVMKYIVEPVVMTNLRSLLDSTITDATTPNGKRARDLLFRFSGLVTDGTAFDTLEDEEQIEEAAALPMPFNHKALDVDSVDAQVLSSLETALQTNMGLFSECSLLHDLQDTESLVSPPSEFEEDS